MLQDISKILNLLGLAAPVVIRPKIFMQKLWMCKIGWDESLSEELCRGWKEIAADLKTATRHSIRWCYFTTPLIHPIVHYFADACQKAYDVVVFLFLQSEVCFITAKSCVAPLKELTLPHLELIAALVATRLTRFVLSSIPLKDPPSSFGQSAT